MKMLFELPSFFSFAAAVLATGFSVSVLCQESRQPRPATGQPRPATGQPRPAAADTPRDAPLPRPRIGDPINVDFPKISPGVTLALDEAIALADARNLSLAAARAEIDQGRAELKGAWATLLPTAQGTMALTYNDKADTARIGGGASIEIRPRETLQGAVQANLPLIRPDAWLGVRASQEGLDVAKLALENVRQQLLLSTAEAFYHALTAHSLIRVQENLLRAALRHLEVARLRHINGVGRRLDVIRARSEVVRIRQELIVAHGSFDNSRDALGLLTGKGGLPVPEEGPPIVAPNGEGDQLATQGSKKRLDLRVKRKTASLREKQLDMTWMRFLPTLNLSWQLTHQFTSPSAFGSPDRTRWNALLTLTVPLYDHTRYAELDSQRAALKQARIESEDARERAGLEIRTAHRNYLTSLENLDTSLEQASLSREALLLAEKAYETGTGSSLDVTDASRTSRRDEVTLAIKRFEIQLAVLKLVSVVGGDLSELAKPKP